MKSIKKDAYRMKQPTKSQPTLTPAALAAAMRGDMSNFIAAAVPGGIERQEAQGQMDELFRETLPLFLPREQFEQAGFTFGNKVDDLFQEAKFPEGCKNKTTDHGMWTQIIDEKGRERGLIFYKAAFYDRDASAHLSLRFGVTTDYENRSETELSLLVTDKCGEINKRIDHIPRPDWRGDREVAEANARKEDDARKELTDWLNENYPEWKSPAAYWS